MLEPLVVNMVYAKIVWDMLELLVVNMVGVWYFDVEEDLTKTNSKQ